MIGGVSELSFFGESSLFLGSREKYRVYEYDTFTNTTQLLSLSIFYNAS